MSSPLSSQLNLAAFWSSWTIGLVFSVRRGTNLERAVRRPRSCCTSMMFFELLMLSISWHLSWLAFIPLWVSMKPINFPPSTPNVHFSGLSFILAPLRALNTSSRSFTCCSKESDFTTMSSTYTSTDYTFEDFVHEALVGRPCVLEAKRHDLIAVVGIDHHEGRLLLVFGVHTYLVVAEISVQEAQNFMVGHPIHQAVDVG